MHTANQLFSLGYTDLVSVIPPKATLSPLSKITAAMLGKTPGRRNARGTWGGYDWRGHVATEAETTRWALDGANFGLKAGRFPALDIDCTDEALVRIIEGVALATLGIAPGRVGRAPKKLLMYRTDEPFGRMRLWLTRGEEKHLVEVLGEGQQYLVYGTHPSTLAPYIWEEQPPPAGELTAITSEDVGAFLRELAETLESLGWRAEREGDGRFRSGTSADQPGLRAPSIETLREVVEAIPNTDAQFKTRQSYLKVGYAIKAACGPERDEEGYECYDSWAMRWDGGTNDPDRVRDDWRRMTPPHAVGFDYLRELARANGYEDATLDFEGVEGEPERGEVSPLAHTEQWLADEVVRLHSAQLRFCNAQGRWYVWDSVRWVPDAIALADHRVVMALRVLADQVARIGATDKEKREHLTTAEGFLTARCASNVRKLMESDRRIAISPDAFDVDPLALNTPSGIVDLASGEMRLADPDALCSKITGVGPAEGAHPEWTRFLEEACGGDPDMVRFLQRLCGYCLTGLTKEQQLSFIWGPGGNGKSIFLNVLTGILGEYARVAPMDTFTASNNERHATELAMLAGARVVAASETQAGKRWDEAKVKSITGGEPVSARFMRQDFFTFLPSFKLVFVGNHRPEIRDVDAAMRRRIQLIPFTVTPRVVDRELAAKLRIEYPAIFSWMLGGTRAWLVEGLQPPAVIRDATNEYFRDEDATARFLEETTQRDEKGFVEMEALFARWQEWARARNEYVGSAKRFSQQLVAHGLERMRSPTTRRSAFRGLSLVPADLLLGA